MQQAKMLSVWTLAALLLAFSAQAVSAGPSDSRLVGFWTCSGQNSQFALEATYDYRADGTYVSTQRVTAGPLLFNGGGGGTYRYEDGMLSDTKLRANIDRVVQEGVELSPDDPVWQELYRQSQSNIGSTTTGPVRIEGDTAYSGRLTCHRQR